MKFFRCVFFPAIILLSFYAIIAYASYKGNKDYDVTQINDMNVNNNVFPSGSLPLVVNRNK